VHHTPPPTRTHTHAHLHIHYRGACAVCVVRALYDGRVGQLEGHVEHVLLRSRGERHNALTDDAHAAVAQVHHLEPALCVIGTARKVHAVCARLWVCECAFA